MIVQEHYFINDVECVRTYSDRNVMIHGGSPEADYVEACDPVEFGRSYTETDIPIDDPEAEEIVSILMGGAS